MMSDPVSQQNVSVLDAALALADRGWRVLPIKPGQKYPPMNSWQHAASSDHRVITNWYEGLYRGFGLGVATGPGSNAWVLDVDVTEGKYGDASLETLTDQHGPLPMTVETLTGSGGRHIWFLWPTDGRIPRTTRDRLGSGLDVRGEGGQVLVAPTIHPNGQPYAWLIDHGPEEVELSPAPEWLLELVCDPLVEPETFQRVEPQWESVDSIAGWFAQNHEWSTMLTADGWSAHRPHGNEQYWTRPGKETREGHSAVLHRPDGPFVIFSTDAPIALQRPEARIASGDGWSYSKFGYYAATKHNGDRSEAARTLRTEQRGSEAAFVAAQPVPPDELDSLLLDWAAFWAKDHSAEEWLAYPIVPVGRQVAIYAPGGEGKSLLALAIAAAVALGRSCLGQPALPPRQVLYFDYEMTEDDLMDRLSSLGYDADDDWSHFHYALLPALDPLDTPEGAKRVIALAESVGAELVVIDTLARAVGGDENDADTIRNFYRWTGLGLKAAGRALVRLDHAGKDAEKGQRGSSAKNDDVDVVWRMARTDDGFTLTTRKARMGWVPKSVLVFKQPGPPLEFVVQGGTQWPEGTKDLATVLDELGVPFGASTRTAQRALKDAGRGKERKLVVAAVKYRNEVRTTLRTTSDESAQNHSQNQLADSASDQPGTTSEPLRTTIGVPLGVSGGDCKGTATPSTAPEPIDTGII